MADTSIEITAGTGTNVDTRTEATNGNHRQVIVIGDPSTNAGVAPVDATNGLAVDVKASALPSGAATAAKQLADGHNVAVASIAAGDNNIGNVDIVSGTVTTVSTLTNQTQMGGQNISMGTGARDAGTQRVTIATNDSLAVTNAGTFAVQESGSALTALQLIDNCISGSEAQVDVVAALPAGTNSIGQVTANPSKLPTTDDAEFVRKYYTNAGAVTDGIIWSPAAGKRWYVTDLILTVSAAATVTLEDDKAGGDDPVMKFELAANGGLVSNFTTPMASGEDAADLLITTSAGNVYVTICGYEV